MKSLEVQKQIAEMTYGTALMQINIRDLKRILVKVPPYKMQDGIKSKLEDVQSEAMRLRSNYQQKLTALAELKQSLLQKAFSGELTTDKAVSHPTLKEEEIA
jgi:type I restriction enzyme S subunit